MIRPYPYVALTVALSTVGCEQKRNTAQDAALSGLTTKVEALEKRLESIEQSRSFDELLRDSDRIAFLTPGADGYSVLRGDLGMMTVSLRNIEPYANGSRVTLQFGNLTSATINGAKVKVEWGKVDAKGIPDNETAKSREVTFTQSLGSGRWTNISVVLEAVPPTDLGFVRIREFGHSGISMLR